ncbi:MBL fold metallo-hydrolase [uncultured Paraglaciecola sp.]|uniref:MBL fold metallo-hydrolase n=1 Tax=uncultured Paraglaciecola sp. TaxID=1765024 RepID=UPI00261AA74E|nr:MBL fold metallo-hydrolase [uncultured Paraglaciecola sp.]
MNWILRIISAVIVLAIIAALVRLIPAHLQVRTVTPPLPKDEALLALLESPNGPTKLSYILTSSQQLERGQISHISIVVEWQDGKRFLIDTGMDHQEAKNFAALLQKMDSKAGEATVTGNISELLGSEIDSISGLGYTHLHIDHTQGTKNFCKARGKGAVVLQTTSQQQLHNFNTTEGAVLVANSCLQKGYFTSGATNNLYKSPQFPGIAAFELGGHTPGSTLWAVAFKEKVLLFSGDITNDAASLHQDMPKSWAYSYLFVPENTARTAEIRKWLHALDQSDAFSVIVSHDLDNTQRYLKEFMKRND